MKFSSLEKEGFQLLLPARSRRSLPIRAVSGHSLLRNGIGRCSSAARLPGKTAMPGCSSCAAIRQARPCRQCCVTGTCPLSRCCCFAKVTRPLRVTGSSAARKPQPLLWLGSLRSRCSCRSPLGRFARHSCLFGVRAIPPHDPGQSSVDLNLCDDLANRSLAGSGLPARGSAERFDANRRGVPRKSCFTCYPMQCTQMTDLLGNSLDLRKTLKRRGNDFAHFRFRCSSPKKQYYLRAVGDL